MCLAHFCGTFRPAPRSGHEKARVKKTRPQKKAATKKSDPLAAVVTFQKGYAAVAPGVFWLPHGPFNGDFLVGYKGDLNTRTAELEVL